MTPERAGMLVAAAASTRYGAARMSFCKCGAEVIWKEGPDGSKIPVEAHEVMRGEDRYVEGDDGVLVEVPERRDVLAFADHRSRCPQR